MGKRKLGEVLQERQHISAEDLEKPLQEQKETSLRLGDLLLQKGLVSKDDVVAALEEVSRFQYVDARFAPVEPATLQLVPRSAAEHYCVLPLVREGKRIVVVMAEPQNLRILDELRFLTGMEISPRLGFRAEIQEAIKKSYEELELAVRMQREEQAKVSLIGQVDVEGMQFFTVSSSEKSKVAEEALEAELRNEHAPAVRLASAIIGAAAAKEASDIHIEPRAQGTVVRIRVDGMLRELTRIPHELELSVTSRIKILADMDIAERRQPQDGRFLVQIGTRRLDMRVSTLPTHYGEKVVLRLLDPMFARVGFTDLGMSQEEADRLGCLVAKPQGMLLVTGPTGSGKTTLLYAILNAIRKPHLNIVTVEDPIEYRLEEVNQVQINPKAGLTFANCLRAILRQDPNVVMVGEIRDTETAEIALQAAQTGHLVLSTLHTNDSISAITRLLDLNIPSYLITSAVTGVSAQRLVRKLCACRKEVPLTPECTSRLLAAGVDLGGKTYFPAGCDACDYTGYRGRTGIYEMLILDDEIRDLVRERASNEKIRDLALQCGLKRMQDDALEKLKGGVTALEEVLRVVSFADITVACSTCGRTLTPTFLFCPYCGATVRQTGSA